MSRPKPVFRENNHCIDVETMAVEEMSNMYLRPTSDQQSDNVFVYVKHGSHSVCYYGVTVQAFCLSDVVINGMMLLFNNHNKKLPNAPQVMYLNMYTKRHRFANNGTTHWVLLRCL